MNPEPGRAARNVAPFIDGSWSHSSSDRQIEIINPSTGQSLLLAPEGCDADVDRAVASARRSFEDGRWTEAQVSLKKRALHRFADVIAAHAGELDAMDAAEMGKPISEAACNATSAANLMRLYAEAVDKVMGDVHVGDRHAFVVERKVPRGVVGAIVPWNFPTFVAVLKLAPALAAGNCVVLKPSELSTRSTLRLAELALEAGLPPGVFNVVPGLGTTVGRALALHGDVDMLTFTGSTQVGKQLMQYAGQSNLKVVMLECGGKSPHIVFNDGIDLEAASESIARSLLMNQGQVCSSGTRVLVDRSIEQPIIEQIVSRFKRVVIGDALDPKTTFGPLASARQYERVSQFIDSAPGQGATWVTGGRRVLQQSGGYFIEPAVFKDVPPRAPIAQEEIFGPVLSVTAFDEEAQALRMANDTIYGLMAYVWTANLSTGMRMMRGIRSPVFINASAPMSEGPGRVAGVEPARQSGIGVEGGLAGMESYMRRQLARFNHL